MRAPAALVPQKRSPVALSVAGSDSGAGAGIQADLLTFASLGVFGTTAITCLTAQNPSGVTAVHPAPASFVSSQLDTVAAYFPVRAAKTGMLYDAAIVDSVASFLKRHPRFFVVVDPVMVSTSGSVLLQPDAIEAMKTRLFPRADLITPNLDEAAVLLGRPLRDRTSLRDAAVELARCYGTAVLLKGGHLRGDTLSDMLAHPSGECEAFTSTRIDGVDTHGSGCTLSAAITAHLARGLVLREAVLAARRYLRRGMIRPVTIGQRRFIAH